MLRDHKLPQERWASRRRERELLPEAFGRFIAGLADWSWFINPLTFRDQGSSFGPPTAEAAIPQISTWLGDIQKQSGNPLGWVIAEEFGTLGGRFHCHGLVSGVAHLSRKFWWSEAYRRFGRTTIMPFNPARGAAFYAAKYAAKALGMIHFGGTLAGRDLSDLGKPDRVFSLKNSEPLATHGKEIVHSAAMPREFYRLGLGKWHR